MAREGVLLPTSLCLFSPLTCLSRTTRVCRKKMNMFTRRDSCNCKFHNKSWTETCPPNALCLFHLLTCLLHGITTFPNIIVSHCVSTVTVVLVLQHQPSVCLRVFLNQTSICLRVFSNQSSICLQIFSVFSAQ